MKRSLILLIVAWMVIPGMAQYIPSQSVETPAPKKDSYWHYGNLFECTHEILCATSKSKVSIFPVL